jgi:Ser/Thr protein kinase RdoA (MazF antagonist)
VAVTDALSIRLSVVTRALRRLSAPMRRHAVEGVLARERAVAERLLARLQHEGIEDGFLAGLDVAGVTLTSSDVLVAPVREVAASRTVAYLKMPMTAEAERSLAHHRDVLAHLHSPSRPTPLNLLVPHTLAAGRHEGRAYHLETALAGRPASDIVLQGDRWRRFVQSAACAALRLHVETAECQTIDAAGYHRLVGRDLGVLREQATTWPRAARFGRRLEALDDVLRQRLVGRTLSLTWIHGDYWPGNLLTAEDGALSGILDWDRCVPSQFPLQDLFHLLAYSRKVARNTEAGEEILGYLLTGDLDPVDRHLLEETLAALALPGDAVFLRAMVMVYWLRFAAVNLLRYPAARTDGRWLQKNVFCVLDEAVP